MNFYDYDNNIQRMTTCYSKESLMETLQIISYYSDYNELRKGVVKAINLYDKKEIMEYRKELKDYFHHRTQLYSYKMSRRKDISVCTYPQYECCGYKKCNLYHICSQLKITNKTTDEIILEKNGQVSERKEVILFMNTNDRIRLINDLKAGGICAIY